MTTDRKREAEALQGQWDTDPRWKGVRRSYTAADVVNLRGSVRIEHTLARMGAERLWKLTHEQDFVNALGALSGNQAMQMVRAGLKAIYLSGWQVAADANTAGPCIPTSRSTRPMPVRNWPSASTARCSAPTRSRSPRARASRSTTWFAPIVADAEAGFGGPLNASN
jgi:isocitrate lyase